MLTYLILGHVFYVILAYLRRSDIVREFRENKIGLLIGYVLTVTLWPWALWNNRKLLR